jgi:cobalt-zinc-cadmium resistance protein CzcA
VAGLIGFGVYSLSNIPIGAVPDVTNNQVQVISTTRDLSTEDVERFLTYPVELEMSNLPGVQEIRSISKFGLSVVTVVFEDDMGTYLPRQLISEKLNSMSSTMAEGLDTPTMGPISTGLGEIYQYILDVEPGYEDRYSVEELRTIQDWIVKRQLSGINGVVEVNTWGGFLKTYEVAVDPEKLKAMQITLDEVFQVLQENNSVAGGGYIEKSQEAYFIRADGLAKNLVDLENIVVKVKDGSPIFVKDVGSVGYGAATRFGAITGNGEGEKVLGQVMMLKGADSKKVITSVVDRVDEIQKSLPEGVFINPFLSRTDLIGRTTFTIAENLILGFLIVLFVVVLLLGNWRSGLLVASVIPLTLLFALSMMYVFGVDANLMSLGAIDFGIIIDGAVIIVEYLTYLFAKNAGTLSGLSKSQSLQKKESIVLEGANKMMHSAVFGQLIIIIVFIPILTLAGVEGKMFRPMGLTFCFALIGAMILCFSYVPVMASLVLKPENNKTSLGNRLINNIMKIYKPILNQAIKFRWIVISFVILLFIITLGIFSRMGGEFVPTLDEGDFVIQPVLKTGMSLAATVEMTTRIEKILKRFPEVKQVVSRIGAAEVPTDPMSMEESDVIITLTEKGEWQSAGSKDELADVFKEAINQEIPNVEIEFTQPIEMRFNELISGARSDLAIKIFGEDLEVLYSKAEEIEKLISDIDGAADISIEKIDGLPQMAVKYDRQKMSRYGVNLKQLNDVIQTGFAGKTVGTLNEGERQFDIVLKYDKAHRSQIEHLRMANVSLPNGMHMPLSTFADIDFDQGPAKISRDDTKRRVVVGVNIRGRDLQSVVADVQKVLNDKLKIPTGYNIQYGGQFENLENATKRLLLAVPIALLLIFVLLYFAFRSVRETLLIYTAIPLSAIGGVLALYFRDMPFSISAGVGFIALFGIAVLNGIVLIEHFKELKKQNMDGSTHYIVQGAVDRIRPVLLTAIAAALGFLPMAISSSAGAEIQRPLATVVIGGLVSATLLTLIILPILYMIFGHKNKKGVSTLLLILPLIFFGLNNSYSQQIVTLKEAIEQAKANSYQSKISTLSIDREKVQVNGVQEVNNYDFFYSYDKNNISNNGQTLHVLGAGHTFKMPGINNSKREAQLANVTVSEQQANVNLHKLEYDVTRLYEHLKYQYATLNIIERMDSIYSVFYNSAKRKNDLGETNGLELLSARREKEEAVTKKRAIEHQIELSLSEFRLLILNEEAIIMATNYVALDDELTNIDSNHPILAYQNSIIVASQRETEVIRNEKLPEINLALFNGFGSFNEFEFFPGVEATVSIPLARSHYKSKQRAKEIETEILQTQQEQIKYQLDRKKSLQLDSRERIANSLLEYETTILRTSNELIQAANTAMMFGEIGYLEFLLLTANALESRIEYLELLHEYNQTTISLNYNN